MVSLRYIQYNLIVILYLGNTVVAHPTPICDASTVVTDPVTYPVTYPVIYPVTYPVTYPVCDVIAVISNITLSLNTSHLIISLNLL